MLNKKELMLNTLNTLFTNFKSIQMLQNEITEYTKQFSEELQFLESNNSYELLYDAHQFANTLKRNKISYFSGNVSADSLLVYLLGISHIDPLSHHLSPLPFWNQSPLRIYFNIPQSHISQAISLLNQHQDSAATDTAAPAPTISTYNVENKDIIGEYTLNNIIIQMFIPLIQDIPVPSVDTTDHEDTEQVDTLDQVDTNDTGDTKNTNLNNSNDSNNSNTHTYEIESYINNYWQFTSRLNQKLKTQVFNTSPFSDIFLSKSDALQIYGLSHGKYNNDPLHFLKDIPLSNLPIFREDICNLKDSTNNTYPKQAISELGLYGFLKSPMLLWLQGLQYLYPKAHALEQLYYDYRESPIYNQF